MPQYEIKIGDEVFEVDAPDFETAQKDLKRFRQDEHTAERQKQQGEAPFWAKPFAAAGDVAMRGIDTISAGTVPALIDKFTGTDEATMNAETARRNVGWAGVPLDIATAARFIPSLVGQVAKLGGGPAARTVLGGTTAAAEGGLYGGVDAATHGREVAPGAAIGAAGGVIGQAAGDVINKGVKYYRGIDDTVPRSNIMRVPAGTTPTRVQRAEIAANQARNRSAGLGTEAEQRALQSEFRDVAANNMSSFQPGAQQAALRKIYEGDPITRFTRGTANVLENRMVGPGVGAAAFGLSAGSLPAAAAAFGATQLGAQASRSLSAGGTREAVEDFRRLLANRAKFQGPMTPIMKRRLGKGATRGLLDLYREEE
jgi:hypothetical protein